MIPSHLVLGHTLFKLSDTIISCLQQFFSSLPLSISVFSFFFFKSLAPFSLFLYKYSTRRVLTQEKLERESRARKILKPSLVILVLLRPSRSAPGILWQVRAPPSSHFVSSSTVFLSNLKFLVIVMCLYIRILMNLWVLMCGRLNSVFFDVQVLLICSVLDLSCCFG